MGMFQAYHGLPATNCSVMLAKLRSCRCNHSRLPFNTQLPHCIRQALEWHRGTRSICTASASGWNFQKFTQSNVDTSQSYSMSKLLRRLELYARHVTIDASECIEP